MLRAGAIVLLPRFDVDRTIKAIRRHRPTIFPGVPTLYQQILDAPALRRRDLRSVRLYLSGAVGLGPDTVERLEGLAGSELIQAYGLTEASPAVTANPLGGGARNRTVGLPLPQTDVVVVDADEPTRVLSKGWLRTGDIGVMAPDGYVTILERQRDMIKVSGFSVFPTEVEDVLRRHPAIIDCAVVGLPDDRRGEKVIAYVVEHPAHPFSEDELRRHCERFLTHYKLPQEYRPRADLPRNLLGKVLRRTLREEPTQART